MVDNLSWLAVYSEIVLLVMGCVIALVDLGVTGRNRNVTHFLTLLTMGVVAGLEALYASSGSTFYGWGNMVVSDSMGSWLKCFAAVTMMACLVYGRPYAGDRDMVRGGGLFSLSTFMLLGIFVMISANNFLVIYLGLELLTLSSYALVALRRDSATATEAAMKYFVLGAMASGFLLYGLSMIYGATGTLDIGEVFKVINAGQVRHQVLVFGVVFIVSGLAFKLVTVPFHMWAPDVYQGAPTVITLIISSAPKLAGFGIAMRLLVDALLPLAIDWQQMLAVLAVASLFVGNVIGTMQSNIKRMLAYSAISHMGFMFLGLMSGVANGAIDSMMAERAYSSAMFYVVTYVLTVVPAFGVVLLLAREGFESEEIADFAGLNRRSPLYAGIMCVCMFSLAGIPPLVGFYAKLSVLEALISSGGALHVSIAVYAVLMSVIGAFYYLRVVKVMYFDQPITATTVSAPADVRVVLPLNGALVFLVGILPGGLMALCADAIVRTLAS